MCDETAKLPLIVTAHEPPIRLTRNMERTITWELCDLCHGHALISQLMQF